MKLVPKAWDEYNPVLVLIGAFFMVAGGYGLAIMGLSGPWVIWLLRGIPGVFVALGALILARQFQRRRRETILVASLGIFLVGSFLTKSYTLSSLAAAIALGFFVWRWVRDRKSN